MNTLLATLSLLCTLLTPAHAARIPEEKSDASHIVVGTVRRVFKDVGKSYTGYVVLLHLEKIEKGDGLKPKELLYTYCYQRNPIKGDAPREPGSLGHSAVPKLGQRIKVFLKRNKGLWEGLYPHWFEAAPEKD